jgi:CelD/BcsL family acetyltransferase involved in cellulose biosynthesis
MTIDVLRASQLTSRDRARWAQLQSALGPEYSSPFLSPGWAVGVDAAQAPFGGETRVAILREGSDAVAFLPVKAGSIAAQPAGAPLCDYQGLISAPGANVDPRELLRALEVDRYDFCHMLASDPAFAPHVQGTDISWMVDLTQGWDAYEQDRRAAGTDILKDIAKKRRKIERDLGPIEFKAFSHSKADFETLFALKREQLKRTRQTDVTSAPWVRLYLENLFESRDPDFGGVLFTMHIGDRLAAAQFNVRGGNEIHAWFIAQDESFDRHSPGLVMFGELIRWMADSPYRTLDLGPVAYRFKDRLANRQRTIAHGYLGLPATPATLMRAAQYGVRRMAESLPLGRVSAWPGKAMRRLDRWRALG